MSQPGAAGRAAPPAPPSRLVVIGVRDEVRAHQTARALHGPDVPGAGVQAARER